MTELTPDIAPDVLAACQANAEQAAASLTRTLDQPIELTVGDASTLKLESLPEDLRGPGLAIAFNTGDRGAIALIAESTGLLPAWVAEPDADGASKLAALAQELSTLLLPAGHAADASAAASVDDLAAAVERGGIADGAGMVPLSLSADGRQGVLHLIWPANTLNEVVALTTGDAAADEQTADGSRAAEESSSGADLSQVLADEVAQHAPDRFEQLPPYAKSMLRIKLPVTVRLASKKQSINEILELGAGSIIKFEKSCDEPLSLEVGGHSIARGEAVKVGDKFGIRIQSMILPEERFHQLRPDR